MKKLLITIVLMLLAIPVMGQLKEPTPIPTKKVFKAPPAWQTVKNMRLDGFAMVTKDRYAVWDVEKRVNKSRQKVSIELLDDGSFMVYWPLEDGKKTAYVHLAANFNGLGALVHEILYGDPDAMIQPRALEDQ